MYEEILNTNQKFYGSKGIVYIGEKIIVISDPGRQEWDGNWNQLIRNAEGVVIFEVAEYLE